MQFEKDIATAIKAKKELAALDDSIILDRVNKKLLQEKKIREKIEAAKSFKELSRATIFKEFVKEVRSELRSVYGVFDLDEKKEKKKLLTKIKEHPEEHLLEKLLQLHQSSKERFLYYKEIYTRLFAITGKPTSILDLACGYNPYSYDYLGCSPFYVAIDLPSDDLKDIAEFFEVKKIEGDVLGVDLVRDYEKVGLLTKGTPFDVVFLFKALDSFESVKKHVSGKLLDVINAKWIIASFPTMSLGGKKHIPKERRAWFEKLLKRREWYFEKIDVGDEVFYVIIRNPDLIAKDYYETHGKKLVDHLDSYDLIDQRQILTSKLKRKDRILDVGTGTGKEAKIMFDEGFQVTGLERSSDLLSIAKKKKGPTWIQGDMSNIPVENETFDAIYAVAVLVHLYSSQASEVLKEFGRVLKKKGLIYLGIKGGAPETVKRFEQTVYFQQYTEEQIKKLLTDNGYNILVFETRERVAFDKRTVKVYSILAQKNIQSI